MFGTSVWCSIYALTKIEEQPTNDGGKDAESENACVKISSHVKDPPEGKTDPEPSTAAHLVAQV